ncbi:hypothetical protein Drorol1_Dr00000356 [Drosera rotundifolia]
MRSSPLVSTSPLLAAHHPALDLRWTHRGDTEENQKGDAVRRCIGDSAAAGEKEEAPPLIFFTPEIVATRLDFPSLGRSSSRSGPTHDAQGRRGGESEGRRGVEVYLQFGVVVVFGRWCVWLF